MLKRNTLLIALTLAFPLLAGCDNCDDLQTDSQSLMDEVSKCSGADSCKLVDMYALLGPENCMGAFQCTQAINARVDLDQFQEDAVMIVEDYDTCSMCAQASCPNPATLAARCNETTHRCETYSTEAIGDAGVSD